ncbi:uncharacterized protein LOC111706913 [Eurytemora carolleeae]|uniref:uncharacterized protein LOC111706913 n=1 Tax=Eurytemora carolleeae TaxID=1294199 RepID=UPI000C77FEA5|nr:uncharacterized protein LOC111706913 [Eurytemora carolleeae]|eukprot:XP_023335628.1 uncharacterized protein LOC111706913 [Eurytemora affinis]
MFRFLVNGTKEFKNDPYMTRQNSLSYHWSPFWEECPVCHPKVQPDYILHMETLDDDINQLLSDVGLGEYRNLFPHTHKQKGGQSSEYVEELINQISAESLQQLNQIYELDHQLFMYNQMRKS